MPAAPSNLVLLSGAGLSAASGIRTFRDLDGLWEGQRPEDVATPEAFARDPHLVHRFYNARRQQLRTCGPNPAHLALARLEREFPGTLTHVTQNVDDLLERAGARQVIHMHGEIRRTRCTACDAVTTQDDDLSTGSVCGHCGAAGTLRPHIVWFGEVPFHLDRIAAALDACDQFVAIGTSGLVYPAAGFVQHASAAGAKCLEINLLETDASPAFDDRLSGPAEETVPGWVDAILAAPGH